MAAFNSISTGREPGIALEQWVSVTHKAAKVVADILDVSDLECTSGLPTVRGLDAGAYVSITTSTEVVQVGIRVDPASRVWVARTLLDKPETAPDPSRLETEDALCEVINILAGRLKNEMLLTGAQGVSLGLPFFLRGRASPIEDMQEAHLTLKTQGRTWAMQLLHCPEPSAAMANAA